MICKANQWTDFYMIEASVMKGLRNFVKHFFDNLKHKKFKRLAGAYSESFQTSKMELFAKIVNGSKPLTFSQKAPSQMFDRILNTPLL